VKVAVAMTPPIPPHIRDIVRHEFERGYSDDQIHAGAFNRNYDGSYNVSLRTLRRMRKTWKEWDMVYIPFQSPYHGRPRVISDILQEELLCYLDFRPMAYLDEMVWFLFDEFDLVTDEATVWRCLHRLGWSRKNIRKIAKQRNQDLRDRWFVRLSGWRADQLIFLDESAACERTGVYLPRYLATSLTSSLL